MDFFGVLRSGLALMVLSSIIMPSIIVNPKWDLLMHISTLSGTILTLGLCILIAFNFSAPQLLRPSLIENPSLYHNICAALIIGLIISMIATYCQLKWIRNEHFKLFEYLTILGEVNSVEEKLTSDEELEIEKWIFPLACRHQQEEIVALFLKYGQIRGIDFNAKDWRGWSAYHFACQSDFKNENIKRMIEENANTLDIDLTLTESRTVDLMFGK